MKLLQSKKLELPKVFLLNNREEIKEVPIGIPFIVADDVIEDSLIRILEYEVLYQKAIKSGYPFKFKQILKDNGYIDITDFSYSNPVYMDVKKSDSDFDKIDELDELKTLGESSDSFKRYIKDSSAYVDVEVLKKLNVFPLWLTKIEDAISTNIHNFASFDNNMYNKKLEGMYGGISLKSPNKNLIIIDISSSIPRAVSSTCLSLAKNLVENFYADLIITGSKSTLYSYEEIYKLDVTKVYDENGMDNDQTYFKKIVTSDKKIYETAIIFGDNHHPGQSWNNKFNEFTKSISDEDGKKLNQFEINKIISFHKDSNTTVSGYGRWFSPKEIENISDWVKYLN